MSGRDVMQSEVQQSAVPTIRDRRIAEAVGRGFFSRPASQQQLNNLVDPLNAGSLANYPLDDLTLEGVKLHLSSLESVFMTPISDRFGSISVPQRRQSLSINSSRGLHDEETQYGLTIQNKNGTTMAGYQHMRQMKLADLLTFILDSFDKFQLISVTMGVGSGPDWTIASSELCVAAVEMGGIDVRSFHLHNRSTYYADNSHSLANLITALSPSLRHLWLKRVLWQPELLASIDACQQLRSLDLQVPTMSDAAQRALLNAVGLLPRLAAFQHTFNFHEPPTPWKRHLVLEWEWWLRTVHQGHLDAGDGWAFKNFLQRIATFTIYVSDLRLEDRHLAAIDFIASSMNAHSPSTAAPHVVIISDSPDKKPIEAAVLVDWARLVSKQHRRVIVILKSDHRPLTMAEMLATEVAVNEANPNILGLVTPEPLHQEEQTFHFHYGSELCLRPYD